MEANNHKELSMKIRGKNLKITTVLLSATLIFPSLALAQNDGKGQGYVFGSFGTIYDSPDKRVGGGIGFERLFGPGVGFGLDFQGFGAVSESSSSYGGIVFTANGTYHLRNVVYSGKIVPFGTAGYSGLAVCSSECGGISGFNFGGGVTYWFKPNRGLRVEFRDHVYSEYSSSWKNWEFRAGFSF